MSNYEELKVWQKSIKLARYIYELTNEGLLNKDFGLRDQMRRSVVSISSNIAEGDELNPDQPSLAPCVLGLVPLLVS